MMLRRFAQVPLSGVLLLIAVFPIMAWMQGAPLFFEAMPPLPSGAIIQCCIVSMIAGHPGIRRSMLFTMPCVFVSFLSYYRQMSEGLELAMNAVTILILVSATYLGALSLWQKTRDEGEVATTT